VFVGDVAAAYESASGSGVRSSPARPIGLGVRQAVVADSQGQRWVLTQHARDTDPADRHGQVFGPIPG